MLTVAAGAPVTAQIAAVAPARAEKKKSCNIGKTPGAQVQQSSAPSDRMADFRHRCVNANRIDSRSA
jgi:hypothetical protein